MDYFCAFSSVCFSFCAFLIYMLGTDYNWKSVSAVAACAAVFVQHVYQMAFVRFDYGYNMTVNIAVGLINSFCWLAWSMWYRKERPYVWKAALSVLMLDVSVLLELLDFAPILWTLDSHALWHASTAPIQFLWYGFLIDDALFAAKRSDAKQKFA